MTMTFTRNVIVFVFVLYSSSVQICSSCSNVGHGNLVGILNRLILNF